MKTTRVIERSLVLSVSAALALGATVVQAQIIYQDDFSGSGSPLNGASLDIGSATWTSGSDWYDDGTAATTVAGGPSGQAAWLPFTPANGMIYTAVATILNDQPNWIGFGFLPTAPAGGDWTVTDFSVRHSNAPGYGWMLTRNSSGNDQEGFLGAGTAGGQSWNGDVADPTVSLDIGIVLDTTAANWTVEWFINGASQGAPMAYGSAGNPGIGGIGFSHDRNSAANNGGVLSYFELSQVPEPTTFALAGLGMAGLLIFRRRR
jgi:hypothetical protein